MGQRQGAAPVSLHRSLGSKERPGPRPPPRAGPPSAAAAEPSGGHQVQARLLSTVTSPTPARPCLSPGVGLGSGWTPCSGHWEEVLLGPALEVEPVSYECVMSWPCRNGALSTGTACAGVACRVLLCPGPPSPYLSQLRVSMSPLQLCQLGISNSRPPLPPPEPARGQHRPSLPT